MNNEKKEKAPVVLITGASRGIGRGIACEFAAAGWSVIINYAGNREAAEETARMCKKRAEELESSQKEDVDTAEPKSSQKTDVDTAEPKSSQKKDVDTAEPDNKTQQPEKGGSLLSKASEYRTQKEQTGSAMDDLEQIAGDFSDSENVSFTSEACESAGFDTVSVISKAGVVQEFPIIQADIGKGEDRERLVDFAWERHGGIDCLINNAGIAPKERNDLLEMSENSFDDLMNTNLKGPFFLTQTVANRWIDQQHIHKETHEDVHKEAPTEHQQAPSPSDESGDAQEAPSLSDESGEEQEKSDRTRPRCVIFVSSISADTVSLNRGEYCLSKSGIAMAASLFSVRLAEAGIPVYEVRPGIIQTDMTAGVREKYDKLIGEGLVPQKRWGTSEDMGRAARSLAEGDFAFSTGTVIYVDGGFHIKRL